MQWVVNATCRPLYPRGKDSVAIVQEAVWAPEPVWTGAKNLDPHRDSIPVHKRQYLPRVLPDVVYRGADKSLARSGRKQATATKDFDVHISYS